MADSLQEELLIDQQVVEFQEAPEDVPLPVDDEDMEEGEVSDGESRANGKERVRITIQNKDKEHLPDLLQEIGGSGDIFNRESAEKIEARAKRFNLDGTGTRYDEIIKLYESLGVPANEYKGQNIPNREYKLEAIHMRGFNGRVIKSEDIYEYFKDLEITPVSFEWVDSNSCNVIWALATSSAKALLVLSRPIVVPPGFEDDTAMEDEDMVLVRKADEYSSEKENSDNEDIDPTLDDDQRKAEQDKRKELNLRKKLLDKFDMPGDVLISLSELGTAFNSNVDYSKWRLGKPTAKLGNRIFMRIATRKDFAVEDLTRSGVFSSNNRTHPDDANRILRTTGGLMSSSRKRKIQAQMSEAQAAADDYELSSKRYSGSNKNPWQAVAENWTGIGRNSGHKDFADELGELASMVQKRGRKFNVGARLGGREIKRVPPVVDWDAPEQNEAAASAAFRGDDHQDADSESEDAEDERWNKKLKRPRMSMVADEVEQRVSAKSRLNSKGVGSKRKMRSFEFDDDEELPESKARENLVMNIKANVSNAPDDLRSRIPGKGLSDRLKSRLGSRNDETTKRTLKMRRSSGESIEKEDLSKDFGGPLPNMVIQVTQSPPHRRETSPDDDEEMDLDHRDVPSKVTKIKTERGEEERKQKMRREREREERREREQKEKRREKELERDRRERKERERQRTERHNRRAVEERRQQRHREEPSRKSSSKRPLKIKKEKLSDDEKRRKRKSSSESSSSDSSSSDDDSSSSDSSSDDSDSGSSSSSSSSSDSDSSSSNSSTHSRSARKAKPTSSSTKKNDDRKHGSSGRRPPTSKSSRSDGKRSKGSGESKALNDKLQDYLKKAKERQKKDSKKK